MAKKTIVNLTQHPATDEQRAAGVFDPKAHDEVRKLLTFDEPPSRAEINARAEQLAVMALAAFPDYMRKKGRLKAMIGGAPYLMSELEARLALHGVEPLYAFSRREATEIRMPDGSVRKTAVFKHAGFVPAAPRIVRDEDLTIIVEDGCVTEVCSSLSFLVGVKVTIADLDVNGIPESLLNKVRLDGEELLCSVSHLLIETGEGEILS